MQVNSAFRAFWLASSEVNRKYYSPLSKWRETKWLPVLCRLLRSKFYWLIIQIVWYVLIKQVFVLTSCWLKWWIFTSTLVNNYCFFHRLIISYRFMKSRSHCILNTCHITILHHSLVAMVFKDSDKHVKIVLVFLFSYYLFAFSVWEK